MKKYTLGILGVRGYVGRELLGLFAHHQDIQIDWVSSRQLQGKTVVSLLESDENFSFKGLEGEHYLNKLRIETLDANEVASKNTDIIVLALPNGLSKSFVDAIKKSDSCQLVIDLSADYRFDSDWIYSIPELLSRTNAFSNLDSDLGSDFTGIKISNPGCYATAMQIALAPLTELIEGRANCFGISGYSGAGTKPSPNNNPDNLRDNILPYALLEHLHEKEVAYQLNFPISFSPHVASFFRGISMTVQVELKKTMTSEHIFEIFNSFYKNDQYVNVTSDIPTIRDTANTFNCDVGGFKLSEDGKRLSLVSSLDNLLKGAASQALQNIELALNIK